MLDAGLKFEYIMSVIQHYIDISMFKAVALIMCCVCSGTTV